MSSEILCHRTVALILCWNKIGAVLVWDLSAGSVIHERYCQYQRWSTGASAPCIHFHGGDKEPQGPFLRLAIVGLWIHVTARLLNVWHCKGTAYGKWSSLTLYNQGHILCQVTRMYRKANTGWLCRLWTNGCYVQSKSNPAQSGIGCNFPNFLSYNVFITVTNIAHIIIHMICIYWRLGFMNPHFLCSMLLSPGSWGWLPVTSINPRFTMLDLRFPQWWLWRVLSSGMWRSVVW
jgi:hypothetical protein